MSQTTVSIAATADDGFEYPVATTWHVAGWPADNLIYIGDDSGDSLGAFRWQLNLENIAIASATLRVYSSFQSGTPSLTVYGDDSDDCVVWSTSAYPSNRTYTTASTNLSPTGWGTPGYKELDVTSIVTEILDRAGWSANNYLGLVFADNGSTSGHEVGVHDYAKTGTNYAELVINYTNLTIDANTASLSLTTYPTIVNAETNVTATTDSLALTEYTATISLVSSGTNVLANTDSLILTEYTASINAANNIAASTDTISITTYQATVDITTLEDRVTLLEEYLSAGPITDSNNFILKIDDGSLTMYYKEGNYHVI